MTRPLRRAHFRIWIGLAISLTVLLAASLWLRPPALTQNPALEGEVLP
jgi:hypothetical protein